MSYINERRILAIFLITFTVYGSLIGVSYCFSCERTKPSIRGPTDLADKTPNLIVSTTLHDPIYIVGDKYFHKLAKEEGWDLNGTRNGNESRPYIIDGYEITDSLNHLIAIRSTKVYFQVSNCKLRGLGGIPYGIQLLNVKNGRFVNNTISINIKSSPGISLERSSANTITNNHITGTGGGISIGSSEGNLIINNTISSCVVGIRVDYDSTGNTISNNYISACEDEGISLYISSLNIISNNTIMNNGEYGVRLGGTGNTVIYNDFISNNIMNSPYYEPIYLWSDSSNNVSNNFWDEWSGPDGDSDGIVDDPYIFSTPEFQILIDSHPKTLPNNPRTYSVHFVSRPRLLFPRNVTQNNITAHWYPCFDSWNHSVTYSVNISRDIGVTWNLSAIGLNTTQYTWNTSSIEEGTTLQIKLVATCFYDLFAEKTSEDTPIWHILHTLTPPTIIAPKGNEQLNGHFSIKWEAVNDSWNHYIRYSLFSSNDSGDTWIDLEDGTMRTSYRWDTTLVVDGTNYRIKVIAKCASGVIAENVSDTVFSILNNRESSNNQTNVIAGLLILIMIIPLFIIVTIINRKK